MTPGSVRTATWGTGTGHSISLRFSLQTQWKGRRVCQLVFKRLTYKVPREANQEEGLQIVPVQSPQQCGETQTAVTAEGTSIPITLDSYPSVLPTGTLLLHKHPYTYIAAIPFILLKTRQSKRTLTENRKCPIKALLRGIEMTIVAS